MPSEKIADRPHPITIGLALIAAFIALIGVVVAYNKRPESSSNTPSSSDSPNQQNQTHPASPVASAPISTTNDTSPADVRNNLDRKRSQIWSMLKESMDRVSSAEDEAKDAQNVSNGYTTEQIDSMTSSAYRDGPLQAYRDELAAFQKVEDENEAFLRLQVGVVADDQRYKELRELYERKLALHKKSIDLVKRMIGAGELRLTVKVKEELLNRLH